MADFDPDAYLHDPNAGAGAAPQFDPDTYLSHPNAGTGKDAASAEAPQALPDNMRHFKIFGHDIAWTKSGTPSEPTTAGEALGEDPNAGALLESGDFWRGAGRGALRTWYGLENNVPNVRVGPKGTIEHVEGPSAGEQEAAERARRLGLDRGANTPEGIAGEVVGGTFGPNPYPVMRAPGEAALPEAESPTAIEEGHPLTTAAKSEASKLGDIEAKAKAAGVEIEPRVITPGQKFISDAAREDLDLPENSPVTKGLIQTARKQATDPAYGAVRNVGEYEYKGPDLSKLDPVEVTNPDGSTRTIAMPKPGSKLNGSDTVDLSKEFRAEAERQFNAAETNPDAYRRGVAYKNAAKAVEKNFRESAGQTELADNWDKARQYAAKSYQWERTLDGSGEVSPTRVKRLALGDEVLSEPMERASVFSNRMPSSQMRPPSPGSGVMGKALRYAAPFVGGAVGGIVGGPAGSGMGASAAEHLVEKVLPPH